MRVGFACICTELGEEGRFKSTTIASLNKLCVEERVKKVKRLTLHNLNNTKKIIKWCIQNGIELYRLSSNIIPRSNYIEQYWDWENDKDVIAICSQIKMLITISGIRVSFHPDSVVYLGNFKDDSVFEKTAYPILDYHHRLSDLLGVNALVVHCGGKYGDMEKAMDQFEKNFNKLPKRLQRKLRLENDKIFNTEETLHLASRVGVPMILDIHHEICHPSSKPISHYMDDIKATWEGFEKPKVHLSSGRTGRTDYAHADYVTQEDYDRCVDLIGDGFDLILESKMKEQAVFALNL